MPAGDSALLRNDAGQGNSTSAPQKEADRATFEARINLTVLVPGLLAVKPPAVVWTSYNFPNPTTDPKACGLVAPGLICDPDFLLANATRLAIQDRLQRLREDLQYVLAVVVVKQIDVSSFLPWPSWRHQEAAVDVFARKLLARWHIGDGTEGPGVMLAVAREPDSVSVIAEQEAVCKGLNSNLCRSISDYGVLPYVDSGYLDRGIVSGVEEIAVALRHPPEPLRPWQGDKLFALCCLVTCFASVICVCGYCCRDDSESRAPRRPLTCRDSSERPGSPSRLLTPTHVGPDL